MRHGVSESISQRNRGEEVKENSRIQAVMDELGRRSQVYETPYGNGRKAVKRLSFFCKSARFFVILRIISIANTIL